MDCVKHRESTETLYFMFAFIFHTDTLPLRLKHENPNMIFFSLPAQELIHDQNLCHENLIIVKEVLTSIPPSSTNFYCAMTNQCHMQRIRLDFHNFKVGLHCNMLVLCQVLPALVLILNYCISEVVIATSVVDVLV